MDKIESEKRLFKGSIKLNNLKRKVVGLLKLHQYEEAEIEAKSAMQLQNDETRIWNEKIEQKKKSGA